MKVAWWKDKNNFGDCLTPVLLERLAGIKCEWSEPLEADFIGIGSYLDSIITHAKIWGSGFMFEEGKTHLHPNQILAVRGKLTQEKLGIKDVVLGDPGLLCKLIAKPSKKKHQYGFIPHWNCPGRMYGCHTIDITQDIDKVISEVASCEKIISSSLHGIVLADALGIPRNWKRVSGNPGEGFKFRDYQSIYGTEIVPNEWQTVSQTIVDDTNKKLLEVLKKIND